MDFSGMCRICLGTHEHNNITYDIFTCKKRKLTYCDMLSSCTKLRPCVGDGLPHLICKNCCRLLKRTYSFTMQCEVSDRKLRRYINSKLDMKTPSDEVKDEDGEVKIENVHVDGFEHKFCVSIDENEVKLEPCSAADDSCWDAEDDNFLMEVREHKISEDYTNGGEPLKKKRGKKKKLLVEGVPESKLLHQCDICGKYLSTKSNLKAHKICHTDLRPFKCTECAATFRGHSALFQHRKLHTGETPFHCEYCPKQFRRRAGLINHIRVHTGEKIYSCDICRKSFVQNAQLSTHMKRHKGEKSYLCQDCGKGFSIKADLKVHQRIHNGEKPYSCHLCTKTFATSGNLNIHVRIHNREIRYSCKECGRGFVTCSAFNVHVKRHRGQRDYRCECGKTFYTSSALKQHMVVHTGEKKYQCKICQRKFSQTSHLSRHFKRDHAKGDAPPPPSDHYKLVLTDTSYKLFAPDSTAPKLPPADSSTVKCESS